MVNFGLVVSPSLLTEICLPLLIPFFFVCMKASVKVACHEFGLWVKYCRFVFTLPFSVIVRSAMTVSGDSFRTFNLKVFLALTDVI